MMNAQQAFEKWNPEHPRHEKNERAMAFLAGYRAGMEEAYEKVKGILDGKEESSGKRLE